MNVSRQKTSANLLSLTILFGMIVFPDLAKAQGKFSLELSGGLAKSFVKSEIIPHDPYFEAFTKINWNASLGMAIKLKPEWHLITQAEYVRRNYWRKVAYNLFSEGTSINSFGMHEPQVVMGLRKYWDRDNSKFYFQPGISMVFVPELFNIPTSNDLINGQEIGLIAGRKIGWAVRADIGYKFLNKRENYFLLGVRYQQGLTLNQHLNVPLSYAGLPEAVFSSKSRNSFASLYTSYGINTSNLNKYNRKMPKRYYNQNKMIKNELANADGFYLMAYGGFRIKEPITPRQDIYFNSSGQFSTVLGYKSGRYSLETGYGQFSAGNNISFDYGIYQPFWTDWVVYGINTPFVPLTFKYDIQISEFKTVRFGPSFSSYFLLRDNTHQDNFIYRTISGGVIFEDGSRIDLTGVVRPLPIEVRKYMFFNAGMHLEFLVFNSSFMSLNVTRNFGSPVISRFEADYQVEATNIKFEQEATLNGFRFDFGWKVPLNILDKQKKLALKR